MNFPPFDLAKAINLLIEGFITITGVCIGAWFAFRAIRWQVQTERISDRQLEWIEKATELWSEHQHNAHSVLNELYLNKFKLSNSSLERIKHLLRLGDALSVHLQLGVAFISTMAQFTSIEILRLQQLRLSATPLLISEKLGGSQLINHDQAYNDLCESLSTYLDNTNPLPIYFFEAIQTIVQNGPIPRNEMILKEHLRQLNKTLRDSNIP